MNYKFTNTCQFIYTSNNYILYTLFKTEKHHNSFSSPPEIESKYKKFE